MRIADSVGRVLGDRYRLIRPLGTGASAYVYVAHDVTLRRQVAIKLLHPGLADDEAFLRRFRAEARAVATLHHPNILRVYDWGEERGSPYLVTDLLEGGSLRAMLDRGQLLTPSQAAAVGHGAAEALAHAHRRGLVHRDIKPANLLFDEEGRVCVADFGVARALAESTVTEPAGAIVGTARYAAPEQVRGQVLDARADVYSLALVLVEATTGIVPFAADTMLGTLMGRLDTPLRLPAGTGPLAEVIEAAGAIDPAERMDAEALAAALGDLARSLPPPAPLPLAGLLSVLEAEQDVDPTQLRGRSAGWPVPTQPAPSVLLDPDARRTGDEAAVASGEAGSGRRPAWFPAPPPPMPPADDGEGASARDRTDEAESADLDADAPPDDDTAADEEADVDWDDDDIDIDDDADLDWDAADEAGGASEDGDGAFVVARVPSRGAPRGAGVGEADGPFRRPTVLAVLVVLLLVAAGLSGWVLTHQPAPSATVPSLVGESETTAAATLASRHLVLTVAGRAYDPSAPAGTVTGQTPAGGRLPEHRPVAVTLSLGPQPVKVPTRLAGLSQAEATQLIDAVGLQLGQVTNQSSLTVPQGDVIAASPSSGTLSPGAVIALVISTGKPHVTVPALTAAASKSYAAAAAVLRAAHLVASEHLEYSTTVSAGTVILTQPAAKASLLYGSPVIVEVSKGPHLVVVPGVKGDTVAAADLTLGDAGLDVTGVTGNPGGPVSGTDPAGGESVLYGSAVQILTG